MIKINNSDTLIDIVNKINNCNDKEIVLDFPFWHQILHSYLSLKIIKNKCILKDLIIITNDVNAKKIWSRIGIKYSIIDDWKPINNQNILKHNFTTYSYLKFLLKKYKEELLNFFKKTSDIEQLKIDNLIRNSKTRVWFFITTLLISIFIFIFIFYFAVNKTTVTITPETVIKLRSTNIIFTEKIDTPSYMNNVVIIKKISSSTSLKEDFWTSWVEREDNKKSSWKAIIYNMLDEDIDLMENTRLQTDKWVLYRILTSTHISKATINNNWTITPWQKEVTIEAKELDKNWRVIWINWNINKWIKLTLPWLKEDKEKIYAITQTNISWWSNNYSKFLTEEDIKLSRELFEYKLKQKAIKDIKDMINTGNKENNITSDILWIDNIIKYTDLTIKELWNITIWDKINNFSLSWSINIQTYTYNKNTVVNKMKTRINDSIIKWDEKINFINNDSIRISNIIYKQNKPYEIKATVEIEVFLSHNFNNEENYYVEKLKNEILWLNKDDALKVLLNDTKISEVDIDIRPFFIKKIWNLPNNVEFRLDE